MGPGLRFCVDELLQATCVSLPERVNVDWGTLPGVGTEPAQRKGGLPVRERLPHRQPRGGFRS